MTDKERMHAVLEGKPVDRMPVHASYSQLYHQDHFHELTELPRERYEQWRFSPYDEFLAVFARILDAVPFDIVQPPHMPSEETRENTAYVERDGAAFLQDRESGTLTPVPTGAKTGHFNDHDRANQVRLVHDFDDVRRLVRVTRAEKQIARGAAEGYRRVAQAFGDRFIMTGGVVGTIYGCGMWLGQLNLFSCLFDDPALVDCLCNRIVEQNVEWIRVLAAAGGDAIYIDDATATSDMISPAMYERFSLPHMVRMVDEIHRNGHKAVVIYFGGVSDRLSLIAETGADLLNMEASMKGYVNDLGAAAAAIGDRMSLCTNIHPYLHIEKLPPAELASVLRAQAEAGASARGLVACSASPLTMGTPPERARAFINIGRSLPPSRPLSRG